MRGTLTRSAVLTAVLATACAVSGGGALAAELDGSTSIVFDQFRVPTIVATTEHDAIYMQGYMHAKDRLFQMDFQRRLFSGRVSELVGASGIAQDVQLRTLGLRRAAERSLLVQTPEAMAWLEAYADGVNALLADTSIPLPVEYGALEINRAGIHPWTPLDSLTMAKGLAFGLSFDLADIDRTLALLNYRGVCDAIGCNGLQLFNDDLWRTAPFESNVSIPSTNPAPLESSVGARGRHVDPQRIDEEALPSYYSDPAFAELVKGYRDAIVEIPILERALRSDFTSTGSNWWIAAGSRTDSGYPMIANDPHLSLGQPATFYEVHLNVTGGINVTGSSFPGTPGVVIGCNDTVCWGATVNAMDVTDVYNEVLLALQPGAPTTPTHTVRAGGPPEPLQFIPQVFRANVVGDAVQNSQVTVPVPADQGGVTLVVPRRNNGPIVRVTVNNASPTPLTGLSVQYTGWSGTHEVETLRRFARAGSMADFKAALQYFDVGSQNWAYADKNGNIAYYTSGELPLREDLQTILFPDGLNPPSLIRDGTHTRRHDWLPVGVAQPNQAIPFAILPFGEMPQVENPPQGYISNANNDPIGTTLDNVSWNQFRAGGNGVLYLSAGYASGIRHGRVQRLLLDQLAGGGTLSLEEFIDIQGDNHLLDAEVFTPHLLAAYANATAPGAPPELTAIVADPRVGEAIARLAAWDFSSPTGIDNGWDPGDIPGVPGPASAADIDASVATTIYSMWRGVVVQRVIDTTLATLPVPLNAFAPPSAQAMSALRRLLDNYAINGGVGSSLINFFRVPGVADPDVARDVILLQSLLNGLNLLASDAFAPAFANSTNLGDYRWGKLHRIVFASFLGGPFSIPPPGSPANVSPALPGFARAGGFEVVDASSHNARADGLNEFMFSSGPARRKIATLAPGCPEMLEVIPGGESGRPGSPQQTDQLGLWLVNAYKPLPICLEDVLAAAVETQNFVCGDGIVGPGEQCDDANADDEDGCNAICEFAPVLSCISPTLTNPDECPAEVACEDIATCTHAGGLEVSLSCEPSGPYAPGTTPVEVSCDDGDETVVESCSVTVVDDVAPAITVVLTPHLLWPPNHKLVGVSADVQAPDACGPVEITLVSITSSEPDDAPGGHDGNTKNDIQGADAGTADFSFLLRAERSNQGPGRQYTVTYRAVDGAGNEATGSAIVTVPRKKPKPICELGDDECGDDDEDEDDDQVGPAGMLDVLRED